MEPQATESCAVQVTYDPTTAGADDGALELSFNNGLGATIAIDVANFIGTAEEPVLPPEPAALTITATPATLDFGTLSIVGPAAMLSVSLDITNTSGGGTAPGSIASGLSLSLGTGNNEFTVVAPGTCPDVGPGETETCNVNVTYAPNFRGTDTDTLELSFSDISGVVTTIPDVTLLTGVAQTPAILNLSVEEADPATTTFGDTASETEIDFGTITIGNAAIAVPYTLSLQNFSQSIAATNIRVSSSNSAFTVSPVICPDVAISTIDSCALVVTYNPTISGTDSGQLELIYDTGFGTRVDSVGSLIGAAVEPETNPEAAVLAVTASESSLDFGTITIGDAAVTCLLYTSPSPRDLSTSRMPSSA